MQGTVCSAALRRYDDATLDRAHSADPSPSFGIWNIPNTSRKTKPTREVRRLRGRVCGHLAVCSNHDHWQVSWPCADLRSARLKPLATGRVRAASPSYALQGFGLTVPSCGITHHDLRSILDRRKYGLNRISPTLGHSACGLARPGPELRPRQVSSGALVEKLKILLLCHSWVTFYIVMGT